MLIGGTKWPSMTSTWIVRAPASSTASTCSPRRAKSAARIEGATPCGRHMGWSIDALQWLHAYSAVSDMRTIVECSPQFGHTDISSKRCRQFTQR